MQSAYLTILALVAVLGFCCGTATSAWGADGNRTQPPSQTETATAPASSSATAKALPAAPGAEPGATAKSNSNNIATEDDVSAARGSLMQDLAIALVLVIGVVGLLWVRRHASEL